MEKRSNINNSEQELRVIKCPTEKAVSCRRKMSRFSCLGRRKSFIKTVREFRHRKNLQRRPMSTKVIRAMLKRFEEMGKLGAQPGRGRKRILFVDAVKTAFDAQSQKSEFRGSSARAVSRQTCYSRAAIPRSCLIGTSLNVTFTVSFLNRRTVDLS
ncbi:hypothetical protein TNCV_3292151 [Trichonephila clavipes]|nr:hypothetical protein TNCV_3292151 [Trichonephila clavipes]